MMRISKEYGKRTPHFGQLQEERVKYILAYEGEKTEVQYFQGIIDNRKDLGMNPLIGILPALRGVLHASDSHPLRTLEHLLSHLEKFSTGTVIIEQLVDYCAEHDLLGLYASSEVERMLTDTAHEEYPGIDLNADIGDTQSFVRTLMSRSNAGTNLSDQVPKILIYIKDQEIEYIPGYDRVCLIVDRDRGNFSVRQYDEVVEQCREKNIQLYVSNPTFEFWLLLHSEMVFSYDAAQILENRRIGNRGKRFLEKALSESFNGYKKECIDFEEKFMPHVRDAIVRANQFVQNTSLLENSLGTNVGLLVDELLV